MRALNFIKTSLLAMICWFYFFFMPLAYLAIHSRKGLPLIQTFLTSSMFGLSLTYLLIISKCINWDTVAEKAHRNLTIKTVKRVKAEPPSSRRILRRPTSISPLS